MGTKPTIEVIENLVAKIVNGRSHPRQPTDGGEESSSGVLRGGIAWSQDERLMVVAVAQGRTAA